MIKNKIVKYYARKDSNIALKVIPGHFVTNHSHLNYYLDMTTMKTRQNEAERIAIAMKDYYNVMDKPIDTIVCLDGCEVIGAFLAHWTITVSKCFIVRNIICSKQCINSMSVN